MHRLLETTMTPGEFILLSAAITGAFLALAWSARKPAKKEAPPEPGRWRRFRIDPGPVHSRTAGTAAAEEPAGLRLARDAAASEDARRVVLQGGGGQALIDIAPPWLFPGSRLRVKVGGRPLATVARRKRGKPGVTLAFSQAGPPAIEIGGNPGGREYDVRRDGKVVATVFPGGEKGTSAGEAYFAEVLRSEDPVPVLALVLAVEACLGPRRAAG
jgi:hypothetical protein